MRDLWSKVVVVLAIALLGAFFAACDGGDGKDGDTQDVSTGDQVSCNPDCSGKECGPDGCGGYCGSCDSDYGCNGTGQCELLEACEVAHAIVCGGKVDGNTEAYANGVSSYSCQGYLGAGPEIGFVFSAAEDDHIVAEIYTPFSDLDLLITQASCEPDSCLGYGDEIVELDVKAGMKYFLMVESQPANAGPFTLTVTCHSDCMPVCAGKECGSDGCGGMCGACPGAAPHCADGKCAMQCTPDCTATACGDDGCGGSCGDCPMGWLCEDYVCEPQEDPPDGCEGLTGPGCQECFCEACVCSILPECCAIEWNAKCANMCGSGDCDGCPGEGAFGWACESNGDCLSDLCIEGLNGTKVCSTFCVEDCPDNWSCVFNPEVYHTKFCSTECYADCTGRECGSDGCGGSCGNCSEEHVCMDGKCDIGSVVSGACTNDADMTVVIQNGETLYEQAMFCGLTCEGEQECAAGCLVEGTGLSWECGGCFADLGSCASKFCMNQCIEGFQNAACAECADQNGCTAPFGECTGFN
jgi:hypothetical protein